MQLPVSEIDLKLPTSIIWYQTRLILGLLIITYKTIQSIKLDSELYYSRCPCVKIKTDLSAQKEKKTHNKITHYDFGKRTHHLLIRSIVYNRLLMNNLIMLIIFV